MMPEPYQLAKHKYLNVHIFMAPERDAFKTFAEKRMFCIVCHKTREQIATLSLVQKVVIWAFNKFYL